MLGPIHLSIHLYTIAANTEIPCPASSIIYINKRGMLKNFITCHGLMTSVFCEVDSLLWHGFVQVSYCAAETRSHDYRRANEHFST